MPVSISTQIIHASFAAVINSIQPNANIYDNPNQQGTVYPAWFIVHRSPVEIKRDFGRINGGNRYNLTYQIDLWYMLQENITGLYDKYTEIAEALDEKLEYLKVFGSDAVLHVHDRTWELSLNALKYSVTLRFPVWAKSIKELDVYMQVIEDLQVFLRNSAIAKDATLYFRDSISGSGVSLPDAITAKRGETIKLPRVRTVYENAGITYTPLRWTAGEFDSEYELDNNYCTTLLWEAKCDSVPIFGTFGNQYGSALPLYGFFEGTI